MGIDEMGTGKGRKKHGEDDGENKNVLPFPVEDKELREQRDILALEIIARYQNDSKNTPEEREKYKKWVKIYKPHVFAGVFDKYKDEPNHFAPPYIYALAEEYLGRIRGIPIPGATPSERDE